MELPPMSQWSLVTWWVQPPFSYREPHSRCKWSLFSIYYVQLFWLLLPVLNTPGDVWEPLGYPWQAFPSQGTLLCQCIHTLWANRSHTPSQYKGRRRWYCEEKPKGCTAGLCWARGRPWRPAVVYSGRDFWSSQMEERAHQWQKGMITDILWCISSLACQKRFSVFWPQSYFWLCTIMISSLPVTFVYTDWYWYNCPHNCQDRRHGQARLAPWETGGPRPS